VGMLASPDDPVALDLAFDWRVAAVAAGLMLALTGLFGAAPAIGASRVAPVTSLHAATSRAGARTGLMRPFVAVQVAFSLAVLFVGSLLVTSFVRLSGIDPGFGSSNVLLLSVEPVRRVEPAVRREALLRVLDHLAQVPGVESVSSADFNLIGRAWTYGFRAPDRSSEAIETTMAPVTAEFFDTMQVPLIAGRSFSAREIAAGSSAPVIVNASFAQRYFGTAHVVGRVIVDDFDGSGTAQHEIVGVVADTRPDLREAAAPALYFPLWLRSDGTIHVRSSGAAEPLAARLRDEIRRADPMFRATVVTTQQAVVDRTLIRERLLALLSGFFSIVGLALAAVGLYGVLSYSVTQRTREIGVRVALGGSRLGVVRTVLADLGVTTVVGTGVGLAAGLYLAGFVESLLFGVRVLDAWNVVRPVAALFAVALIAAALPLFRATRVDPIVALRED
jgi:putative ABC transport system permease protein